MDILIPAAELERAPLPVREWLGAMLLSQLSLEQAARSAAHEELTLAAISASEAAALLDRLRDDYLACQVLLELGRDNPVDQPEPAGIHRLALADVAHHLRLGRSQDLLTALNRIAQAWADVAGSADSPLYALDEAGNLYVGKATQKNLESLWQRLVADRYADLVDANPSGPAVPIARSERSSAAG